jgi:hypothetical protein
MPESPVLSVVLATLVLLFEKILRGLGVEAVIFLGGLRGLGVESFSFPSRPLRPSR